jgi:hypothetical protein
MRHPQAQPKYRVNQLVHVPYSPKEGIIKGIRYVGQTGEYENNHHKFLTKGWEYQIYHWSAYKYDCVGNGWTVWGWLTETELNTIND